MISIRKKAVLGSFVGLFVATVAIVILLVGFIVLSSVIKKLGDTSIKTYNEEDVGIEKVETYMKETYLSLTTVRFLSAQGDKDISNIVREADYG